MSRVKLIMPQNILATFSIPVRITDINYGNHVGNDAFVQIIHEARVQWLQQHGFTELNIEGVGVIMADIEVAFKNESFYGDVVELSIAVGEISSVGFELYYQLSTKRKNEHIILALAKTGMVCYNYSQKKVTAIPKGLMQIINNHL